MGYQEYFLAGIAFDILPILLGKRRLKVLVEDFFESLYSLVNSDVSLDAIAQLEAIHDYVIDVLDILITSLLVFVLDSTE